MKDGEKKCLCRLPADLLFLSNYYTHHQMPTCMFWDVITEHRFLFIATESFSEERKKLGWRTDESDQFVVEYSERNREKILEQVDNAETVILGSAPFDMVKARLKKQKIVFKYSERIFKDGYDYMKIFPRIVKFWWTYGRHKSLYLLAASAYTTVDFSMHGTFIGKSYKWGYFPKTEHYDLNMLFANKQTNKIVWCGRFIKWKHPDYAIEAAKMLKEDGYVFELEMIGDGELKDELQSKIERYNLTECVRILGVMNSEKVREHMEKTGIYLFTSDFHEGWGAVLNESMNSGCAVIASHAIGSVPFLLRHKENGLIYRNGEVEDLYNNVKYLLNYPSEQKRMGVNAYHTIADLWNGEVAAERFVHMTKEIQRHGYCDLYEEGPCSRAKIINNKWFTGD